MFRPKPFWLRWFTSKGAWVTITPNIYVPDGVDPYSYPAVIAHEEKHLEQQRNYGKIRWLLTYYLNRQFMLEQEAEGIALEIRATPITMQPALMHQYCLMLSTKDHQYETMLGGLAADTYGIAEDAIKAALMKLDYPSLGYQSSRVNERQHCSKPGMPPREC